MDPPASRDPWPWVGGVSALAFLVLTGLVNRRGEFAIDVAVTDAVRGLPVPVGVWEAVTFLGGAILIAVAVGFIIAVLATGRIRLAVIIAVVLLGSTLFTELVKVAIERPRPIMDPPVATHGHSFPSGHTLNSAATYGLIALVAWRSGLPERVRTVAVVLGVTLPLLIGISRIALGAHYPTDVLGGWLAGIAFVALGAVLIGLTGAMERDWPT
jgi:undecaprenyl-diphosphatase